MIYIVYMCNHTLNSLSAFYLGFPAGKVGHINKHKRLLLKIKYINNIHKVTTFV